MTWYTGMCEITAMDLLYIYILTLWSNVCYMGFGSNGYFIANTALTSNHYRTNIISGVGYPRSDSIVSLVLCVVAYNIRGTGVALQVFRDSSTLLKMSNISGKLYCWTMIITLYHMQVLYVYISQP
jgi:hypothetical protein